MTCSRRRAVALLRQRACLLRCACPFGPSSLIEWLLLLDNFALFHSTCRAGDLIHCKDLIVLYVIDVPPSAVHAVTFCGQSIVLSRLSVGDAISLEVRG
ncbi:hypothetical protein MUK42_18781 [Musa troglodytarum]|uniref:Uncharacterized protein n=1 Tax=Musa troglodytarum TaxID=320322 RepID=A0A9E7FND9_9LILI|nr:hypothetical protein MUK42_18781 [Musa troglodytarum]